MTLRISNQEHDLFLALKGLIAAEEQHQEYVLSTKDYEFLLHTLLKDIPLRISKFIAGGKEHNADHDAPFVDSCDHIQELLKENIDSNYYLHAILANRGITPR